MNQKIIFIKKIKSFIKMIGFSLLFLFLKLTTAGAQDYDPPYPRLGIFTFSGNTDASLDILKDFDVIALPPNDEMAQKYRQAFPDKILLGTSGCLIAWEMEGIPEEWYYHTVTGERIELWAGTYLMNCTSVCPLVDLGDGDGPKTFIDHALKDIDEKINFDYYDGIFHDWWWGGPGATAKATGDVNNNGILDAEEMSKDSLVVLWWNNILDFHDREYEIPGLKYVVIQIGALDDIWSHVNGSCFEDWPIYNGPWNFWRNRYNDEKTAATKDPKLMIFNASHSQYYRLYPVEPYKNNYRAVRFALASCLFTSAYFYVDEGNQIAHHGNVHFYDEFEAKGMLGYPRSDMLKIDGSLLAPTPNASGIWVRFFDDGVSVVNATGLPQTVTASDLAALDPISGSRYFRILGGQDPIFNNGEEVTDGNPLELWGDATKANWASDEVFGDGTMLFRSRKVLVTPIIIDNHVNNQTSPGSEPVQYTGSWTLTSDGDKFYAFYTDRDYGPFQPDGFAYSLPGSGENVATYIPTIGLPGDYEVFEWHGEMVGSLASDVTATITHGASETMDVTIDQTQNTGQWNSLGTYNFSAGTTGKVELSNQANGIVISDAIKFVFKSAAGEFDSKAPNPPEGVNVIRLD